MPKISYARGHKMSPCRQADKFYPARKQEKKVKPLILSSVEAYHFCLLIINDISNFDGREKFPDSQCALYD